MTSESDARQMLPETELLITRVFNAPVELVWRAWTTPELIAKWWGPRGFTTRVESLDFRSGGQWRYTMIGPDGAEYPVKGIFQEIVPLERIVATDEFDDDFEVPGIAKLPRGIVTITTFEVLGGKTRVSLRIVHPTVEDRRTHEQMGVVGGWNSSLDCLEELLIEIQ